MASYGKGGDLLIQFYVSPKCAPSKLKRQEVIFFILLRLKKQKNILFGTGTKETI